MNIEHGTIERGQRVVVHPLTSNHIQPLGDGSAMAHSTVRLQLAGRRFGRLTVLSQASKPAHVKFGGTFWRCRCDCGRELVTRGGTLTGGQSQSCGCAREEALTRLGVGKTVPGVSVPVKSLPEYKVWQAMLHRCRTPTAKAYKNYGARGIAVCDRWLTFSNFLADMGSRPSPEHSLDRIDNDGNYVPGNCRWATVVEQVRNTRRKRMITHNGETFPLWKWAEITGFDTKTIAARLRRGWSESRALTEPLDPLRSGPRGRR